MLLCIILIFLYVVGLFVTSYSAFRFSEPMKNWLDSSMAKANLKLIDLANLSTKESLIALRKYIFAFAFVSFIVFFLNNQFNKLANLDKYFLGFTAISLYIALSLNTWIDRKEEVFKSFHIDIGKEAYKTLRLATIISICLLFLLIMLTICFHVIRDSNINGIVFDSLMIESAKLWIIMFVSIFVCRFVASIFAKILSLSIVFVPAILVLFFVRCVIFFSKIALKSKKVGINLLVIYTIGISVYSFSGFSDVFGLPQICSK